ncbi:MAG: NusA-like transcription termination signal-binding factor [Desulfurococcaceae archaeon]
MSKSSVKITAEEFRYMALFSEITGVTVRDCIIDNENNRVIFLVNPDEVGKAIGSRGFFVQKLSKILGKTIEVVGYSDKLEEQVKYALAPARVTDVRVVERPNGVKVVYVAVNPADKAIAIGKNGRNVQRARLVLKRHFGIDSIIIA